MFPGYRMKDAKCQGLSSDERERREEKGRMEGGEVQGQPRRDRVRLGIAIKEDFLSIHLGAFQHAACSK